MHLGNISFSIDGSGFSLAPIYDMCSMGFSPKSIGEIPPFAFSPPDIDDSLSFIDETSAMIKKMAGSFWKKLGESEQVSEEFRFFINLLT
jgi:hypothetical protein